MNNPKFYGYKIHNGWYLFQLESEKLEYFVCYENRTVEFGPIRWYGHQTSPLYVYKRNSFEIMFCGYEHRKCIPENLISNEFKPIERFNISLDRL